MANSTSDRDIVGIVRKMNVKRYTPRKTNIRVYSNYNKEIFKNHPRNIPWEYRLVPPTFNTAWELFKTLPVKAINKHAPLRENRIRGK